MNSWFLILSAAKDGAFFSLFFQQSFNFFLSHNKKSKYFGTGQIGYALLPMIARGAMLGPDQPVIIHMLDIQPAAEALNGVKMELIDAAFPLLKGTTSLKFSRYLDKGLNLSGSVCVS